MQRLHHVGYWVDDLDAALKRWNTDLGVGPFQVIDHVASSRAARGRRPLTLFGAR